MLEHMADVPLGFNWTDSSCNTQVGQLQSIKLDNARNHAYDKPPGGWGIGAGGVTRQPWAQARAHTRSDRLQSLAYTCVMGVRAAHTRVSSPLGRIASR